MGTGKYLGNSQNRGTLISSLNNKFYFVNGLRFKLLINMTETLKAQECDCLFKS